MGYNKEFIDLVKKAPSTDYAIEFTNIGAYTLKHSSPDFYFHSNKNPYEEAKKWVKYYIKNDQNHYCIFELGLAYHINALLAEDRRVNLHIIECNADIISIAFRYMDLKNIINNPNVSIEYVPEKKIGIALSNIENNIMLMLYPTLRTIKTPEIKNALNEYFISTNSMYSQKKDFDYNFYTNIRRNDPEFSSLIPAFKGKRMIYIAGGPSLHYYMELLNELQNDQNVVIICASTVYRNLLSDGIQPDYVIMIDANDNMVLHVKNIPATNSQLLYLSTASAEAVNAFAGKKYIVYQRNYTPAEEIAKSNSYTLVNTGGSVSTAAIDIILQAEAKELITFGLDLAYTDNKTHSYEFEGKAAIDNSLTVKSVTGTMIPTINNLNIYIGNG